MRRISSALTRAASNVCGDGVPVIVQSLRSLRNLHQRRHARHKSLTYDRRRYSRNWFLNGNNNFEVHETVAHEREATEMLAAYKCDDPRLWESLQLSTGKLEDLPARQRLDAITENMKYRWEVSDGGRGFDKAKMLLSALECFPEMLQTNQIGSFDDVNDATQDLFVQYVVALGKIATEAIPTHPNAVAMVIRAAEICDEFGCREQRDSMLQLAENSAKNLCKPYAFEREGERITLALPTVHQIQQALDMKLNLRGGKKEQTPAERDAAMARRWSWNSGIRRSQSPMVLKNRGQRPYDRFHKSLPSPS